MPRTPRQKFPPIRQFAFSLFHPKNRPSPSPLRLLRDGCQNHATAYSFSSQHCWSGMWRAQLRQAPLSQGARGSCVLGFAQRRTTESLEHGPCPHLPHVPMPSAPGKDVEPAQATSHKVCPSCLAPITATPAGPAALELGVHMGSGGNGSAGSCRRRPTRAAPWELMRSSVTCMVTAGVCPAGRNIIAFLSPGRHMPVPTYTSLPCSSPSLSQVPNLFSTLLPVCTSE